MKHLKQEFDSLTFKDIVVFFIALFGQIAATVLVFLGMYLEPRGEIHASVLTYYGMASGFTSALLGISYYYNQELRSFKNHINSLLYGKSPKDDPAHPHVGSRSPSVGNQPLPGENV